MKKNILVLCSILFLLSGCDIFYKPDSVNSDSQKQESSIVESTASSVSLTSSLTNESSSQSESSFSSQFESSAISSSPSIQISSSSSEEEKIIEIKSISLNATQVDMKVGKNFQIKTTISPSNATNQTLTYSSSNANVANVNQNGVVTALTPGQATISVTTTNAISKSIIINVAANELPTLPSKIFKATTAPTYGNEYFYAQQLNPKVTNIANGVDLTQYTYVGVDGSASKKVYSVTVDLNLASITVGTASNSYFPSASAVLKNQATAYETATNKKVYAAINGDYFGGYTRYNSNGFCVKDGVVINAKSAFYENLVNGMLALSISYNDVATISKSAPNSSTFYRVDNYIELYDGNINKVGSYAITAIDDQDVLDMHTDVRKREYEVISKNGRAVTNQNVIYVTKTKSYNNVGTLKFPFDGKISLIQKNYTGNITLSNDQVALLVPSTFANQASLSHQVRVGVTISDSNDFSGVKTVIGGRHNLIEDYKIVPNLANESTNDAKKKRARSCVGILGNGKVIIFTCEDNAKGLTLTAVADFMRYLGCRYAFNLDGGGSTGLIVRNNNTLTLQAGLNTRALANTLLVVEK